MPPRWFRLYSEVLHDPHVQRLSPTDFKHWINLLCLANETEPRGTVPNESDVGFALRLSSANAGRLLARFHEWGLIDLDEEAHQLVIHGWAKRQYESDDVTLRVRKHRAQRNVAETPSDTDTDQKQIRPEPEQSALSRDDRVGLVRLFERGFGRTIAPTERESILALGSEHPRERIEYAVREAAELNKRSVRYVQSICENQERNGDDHERPGTGAQRGVQAPYKSAFAAYGQPEPKFLLD